MTNTEEAERSDITFKIIVVGEVGVGKTSLVRRITRDVFNSVYKPTIGVDFCITDVLYQGKVLLELQLWDIGGQERFGNMTKLFYRDAAAAFVVCDSTRPQTLSAAIKWKNDIDDKAELSPGRLLPCFLLYNKCDSDELIHSDEELAMFCSENGFIGCYKTSAVTRMGVEDLELGIVTYLMNMPQPEPEVLEPEVDLISLSTTQCYKRKSSSCCGSACEQPRRLKTYGQEL
ncbi:Ras-related protein Rab [Acrasis kona]|uniref:Ras-related protein Rab n=1 Tax=Acrasis kona TaxID=1008807 RepID=A0AAW2YZ07_9EUKA